MGFSPTPNGSTAGSEVVPPWERQTVFIQEHMNLHVVHYTFARFRAFYPLRAIRRPICKAGYRGRMLGVMAWASWADASFAVAPLI
jgi:hypothetical protein